MGAKKALKSVIFCSVAIGASACEPLDALVSKSVDKRMAAVQYDSQDRLGKLEIENAQLKGRIASLEYSQKFIFSRLNTIDTQKASITEGAGYGVAKTPHGSVIITASGIQPYLDGYKVTLNIGNPSMISFSGSEIEVDWGLPWDTKDKTLAEIEKTRRTKKFSVAKDFPAGFYTPIEVALTPAKPAEVKTIEVGIEWNRVSLRKPAPAQ